MKDFVQLKQIEDVLDKGRAVKHSKLSQLTEEVITDPTKVKGGEGEGETCPGVAPLPEDLMGQAEHVPHEGE